MNDWNYTKKAAKIGLIFGLTVGIFYGVRYYITPAFSGGGIHEYNLLPDLIMGLPILLILPIFYLLMILLDNNSLSIFVIPLNYGLMGAFFGFLMDLIKGNHEKGNEKGVFVRISLGKIRKFVISERFVNCFIIAEFLILVFFVVLSSIGTNTESPDVMYKDGIYGVYWKGTYSDYMINFNESTSIFTERYPNGTIENGTFVANEKFLTLYYSYGKTAEYFVNNSNLLTPVNRSQFSSEEEWKENCYMKELLM